MKTAINKGIIALILALSIYTSYINVSHFLWPKLSNMCEMLRVGNINNASLADVSSVVWIPIVALLILGINLSLLNGLFFRSPNGDWDTIMTNIFSCGVLAGGIATLVLIASPIAAPILSFVNVTSNEIPMEIRLADAMATLSLPFSIIAMMYTIFFILSSNWEPCHNG